MSNFNLITATDTYKFNHWSQYPEGTTGVYSYFEARSGARFPEVVFVGLQPLLYALQRGVTKHDIDKAEALSFAIHGKDVFNRARWDYILEKHGGKLPVEIKAVEEGTVVPVNNVLFTVENTDPKCFWLTSALESFLTHVWHPITVATLSREAKKIIAKHLDLTGGSHDGLGFMLHDFGYRGATSDESARQAGMAHLVNFLGSDTVVAVEYIAEYYDGASKYAPFVDDVYGILHKNPVEFDGIAYSVPATEHSVMTALGKAGERAQVQRLLDANPTGIISCVGDSFDIFKFTDQLGTHFKQQILARDGKFVLRPDSLTPEFRTKGALNVELLERLGRYFGYTTNDAGFKVLNPKVGLIDGDGNTLEDIERTLGDMLKAGWAAENIVFGMGGGLHQKGLDRDTQRFAFKSSAQQRNNGPWTDVKKNPLDQSKASKAGRLRLEKDNLGNIYTVREDATPHDHQAVSDLLRVVFRNGEVIDPVTFDRVRKNAAI